MRTMRQFVEKYGITMKVEPENARPDGLMADSARHFRCTLRFPAHQMNHTTRAARIVVHFSQGSAHNADPTPAEVLSCMASDSAGWENCKGDFNEWCREYGYSFEDRDAERKARKVYNAVERQVKQLGNLVGFAYEELLYRTEGL